MDKKNVECFINEYRDLLDIMGVDVAHSEIQDKYFIFRTNPCYFNNFDYFIEVKEESDLVDVLLSELAYDMHVEIGMDDVDTPECEKNNIGDIIDEYREKDCIPEIAALLIYIKDNISGRDSELMKILESLVSKKK